MNKPVLALILLAALVRCSPGDAPTRSAVSQAPEPEEKTAPVPPFGIAWGWGGHEDPYESRVRQHGSFAALPDRGELLSYPSRRRGQGALIEGAYTWHRVDISEEHALRAIVSGHLRVPTPSGEILDIRYDHHVEHASGDLSWVGHIEGKPGSQTILTFGANAVYGSIGQPDKRSLRVTTRAGSGWLVETDPIKLARLTSAAAAPRRSDALAVPKMRTSSATSARTQTYGGAQTTAAAALAVTTIDVLIGYTPGFATAQGGNSGAVTRLNYLVTVSNEALANSQVNARIRLVHAMPVNYADTSTNESTLEQLTGYDVSNQEKTTPNAAFNALRAARETYGADLVTLVRQFRDPEQDGCGIAWLIGGGRSGISPGDGSDYFGYSVVSDGTDRNEGDSQTYYCRDETLIHELAHNIGSQHDTASAANGDDDGVLDPDEYGAFTYSFGYKTTPAAGNFYTIMAYGDEGQTDYRVFSNPRTDFCGGRLCGTTTYQDNARSLSQLTPIVAGFRGAILANVRNDVDGDGKSDLFFRNQTQGRFAYWLMNGNIVRFSSPSSDVTGYALVATGDFNGDGYVDLTWSNDERIWQWQGTSAGFVSKLIGTQPPGWRIVGAGDVDGDRRSDLFLYNDAQSRFAYWLMNGNIVRFTSPSSEVTGYALVAIGNFNGDAYVDLTWSNGDRIWQWQGTGTGFAAKLVGTQPAGWRIVGAGDVDGDGKSDLLLRNQTQGRFAYWLMNGNLVRFSAPSSDVTGYSLVATGNFNGDSYVDLIWSNGQRIWQWQGTGAGFAAKLVGSQPAGWVVTDCFARCFQ